MAKDTVSIRLRLDRATIDRIDELVGESGRQRFIREAVLERLESDLPSVVYDLMEDMRQLSSRVEYLENIRDTSVFRGELNEVIKTRVCRDELDRKLLAHIIQHQGATTPELSEQLLGTSEKRRTILDRIAKLNERAQSEIGHKILRHERGEHQGKRGAWWAVDPEELMS
ncbi:MAG: hypothetical protein ACXAEF_12630 [Candidatus Thorarchaeota archaeon]|jgi:hypothetical protein